MSIETVEFEAVRLANRVARQRIVSAFSAICRLKVAVAVLVEVGKRHQFEIDSPLGKTIC
jgi:hypothetical protein